ncbi:MAG: hypothetical protein AVDCRST_MAG39-1602, partial [uncultured Sphingomonadaceae bacterium]
DRRIPRRPAPRGAARQPRDLRGAGAAATGPRHDRRPTPPGRRGRGPAGPRPCTRPGAGGRRAGPGAAAM